MCYVSTNVSTFRQIPGVSILVDICRTLPCILSCQPVWFHGTNHSQMDNLHQQQFSHQNQITQLRYSYIKQFLA